MICPLTRDFKETVNSRVQRDPAFATALRDEAISLFLNGEPETARLIMRGLVNVISRDQGSDRFLGLKFLLMIMMESNS